MTHKRRRVRWLVSHLRIELVTERNGWTTYSTHRTFKYKRQALRYARWIDRIAGAAICEIQCQDTIRNRARTWVGRDYDGPRIDLELGADGYWHRKEGPWISNL